MISAADVELFHFVETAEEAWERAGAEYGFELAAAGAALPSGDLAAAD